MSNSIQFGHLLKSIFPKSSTGTKVLAITCTGVSQFERRNQVQCTRRMGVDLSYSSTICYHFSTVASIIRRRTRYCSTVAIDHHCTGTRTCYTGSRSVLYTKKCASNASFTAAGFSFLSFLSDGSKSPTLSKHDLITTFLWTEAQAKRVSISFALCSHT